MKSTIEFYGRFRGMTALHMAVSLGHKEIIAMLIKGTRFLNRIAGASVLKTTEFGFSLAQEATAYGNRDILKMILKARHAQLVDMVADNRKKLVDVLVGDELNF